jgi:putative ABC transport system permease protein
MCHQNKLAMLHTAIKFIIYDKAKSIGALFGVIISIFLIGQQMGIFTFMTSAMSTLVSNNRQYIWVVDEKTTNVNALISLDVRVGKELESIPGVKRVNPIVIAGAAARFENGKSSGITLIGSLAPDFRGGPWNFFSGKKELMINEGAVITEYFDRKSLGGAAVGDFFEINGKKVFIAGNTRGVRGFGSGAFGFTTIERARHLANFPKNKASAFLVEWKRGQKEQVIRTINCTVNGVHAWQSEDFAGETVSTILKSNGIAFSVGTLIIFALVSGFTIIGLTLYLAAVDRIRDYGTLKAIGATNSYLRRLILLQASLFSIVGFIIGYGLIEGFRMGLAAAGTIFFLSIEMKIYLFLITLLIALGGSLFAIARISKLEPAQVFRG